MRWKNSHAKKWTIQIPIFTSTERYQNINNQGLEFDKLYVKFLS